MRGLMTSAQHGRDVLPVAHHEERLWRQPAVLEHDRDRLRRAPYATPHLVRPNSFSSRSQIAYAARRRSCSRNCAAARGRARAPPRWLVGWHWRRRSERSWPSARLLERWRRRRPLADVGADDARRHDVERRIEPRPSGRSELRRRAQIEHEVARIARGAVPRRLRARAREQRRAHRARAAQPTARRAASTVSPLEHTVSPRSTTASSRRLAISQPTALSGMTVCGMSSWVSCSAVMRVPSPLGEASVTHTCTFCRPRSSDWMPTSTCRPCRTPADRCRRARAT